MSLLGSRGAIFGAGLALWVNACSGAEFRSDGVGSGGSAGSGSGSTGKSGANSGGSKASGGSGNSAGSNASGGASAGSATGGAAGSVSSGGAMGSGGSVVSACPGEIPSNGEPCAGDTQCLYGDCCPTEVSCVGGAWEVLPSSCPQPVCPDSPPLAGEDCTCQPDNCRYDMCGMGAAGITVAQCGLDGWQIGLEPCSTTQCDQTICGATDVCVMYSDSSITTYNCEMNPCVDDFSCTCLGPMLCPQQECLYADPATHTLSCTCPNCG